MREGRLTPEVLKEFTAFELKTKEEFVQFYETYRRNNGLSASRPELERRLVTRDVESMLAGLEPGDDPPHFFGVKDGDAMIGTGCLSVWTERNSVKHGYLSELSVDKPYRGSGIAKKIIDSCIKKAHDLDCTYADLYVSTENPVALVTQLNNGFFLHSIEFYGDDHSVGGFKLSKKIDGSTECDKKESVGELREVSLQELETIKSFLDEGWMGIDLKNLGDAKDNDPAQWELIMEKTQQIISPIF